MRLESLKLVCVLVAAGVLLAAAADAGAITRYVGGTAQPNYSTIQEAINACVTDDEVEVADDVYTGAKNRNLTFKGKRIVVRSANGPAKCIISVGNSSPNRGFIFNSNEGRGSVLSGFTITGGRVNGDRDGGGIKINGASPTIRNCVIQNCHAGDDGGGIYLYEASPLLWDVIIRNCYAGDKGGGLMVKKDSEPEIGSSTNLLTDVRYTEEDEPDSDSDWPHMTEIGQEDNPNESGGGGGGIGVNTGSEPDFDDVLVAYNESGGPGGGVWIYNTATAHFQRSKIVSNASSGAGGGVAVSSSTGKVYLHQCFVDSNEAADDGGGLYVTSSGWAQARVVVMRYNKANDGNGGGMYVGSYATLSAKRCTVVKNWAKWGAGGAYISYGYTSSASGDVQGCIFWGNTWGTTQILQQLSSVNLTYVLLRSCCIQGWTGGGTKITTRDPKLSADDDYHLTAATPADSQVHPIVVDGIRDANQHGQTTLGLDIDDQVDDDGYGPWAGDIGADEYYR